MHSLKPELPQTKLSDINSRNTYTMLDTHFGLHGRELLCYQTVKPGRKPVWTQRTPTVYNNE